MSEPGDGDSDASGTAVADRVVTTEVRDRVLIITLRRPEKLNALNSALFEASPTPTLPKRPTWTCGVLCSNARARSSPWGRF